MRFEGLKEGGLYKILGASNRGARACQYNDISDPKGFNLIFIPNNAVIMFLERLDDGNAMILYEDKKLEIAVGTGGYLRSVF
jgi:hypothetical protein